MADKTMSSVPWFPELTNHYFIDLLTHMKSSQLVVSSQWQVDNVTVPFLLAYFLRQIMWGYGDVYSVAIEMKDEVPRPGFPSEPP